MSPTLVPLTNVKENFIATHMSSFKKYKLYSTFIGLSSQENTRTSGQSNTL